ncbi:MAG TPA: hypothetical protein VE959_06710 [Bryobacteraceae bacterium]|nr:hypothetical protein [Bryobacteraceae bacterium]
MWYDGTVNEIGQIIHWLEGTDEEQWSDQTAFALEALSDVRRMAASKPRPDKGPVEILPGDPNMQRALPHVQAMVSAMERKDRRRALESGRAALKEF